MASIYKPNTAGRLLHVFASVLCFDAVQSVPAHFEGRQLIVNGEPLHLKGINWHPVRKGGNNPWDVDNLGYVAADAKMMQKAGINAVRSYEAITDVKVLDVLYDHGIYLMNTVYWAAAHDPSEVIGRVKKVMHHPATLMWVVGNEWNYNGLYSYNATFHFPQAEARVNEVAHIIKGLDSTHPVATIWGNYPEIKHINAQPHIDTWGINMYHGLDFNGLFKKWKGLTKKPLFIGEYGADAFDSRRNSENQDAQAHAVTTLTNRIVAASSVRRGGVCFGGLLFEFSDEWWKAGNPAEHDNGGIAPGGGPYPDQTFNEEWWGVVDIDGNPRKAFKAYRDIPVPVRGGATPPLPEWPADSWFLQQRSSVCGAFKECSKRVGFCCPNENGQFDACCPAHVRNTNPPVKKPVPAIKAFHICLATNGRKRCLKQNNQRLILVEFNEHPTAFKRDLVSGETAKYTVSSDAGPFPHGHLSENQQFGHIMLNMWKGYRSRGLFGKGVCLHLRNGQTVVTVASCLRKRGEYFLKKQNFHFTPVESAMR